jgi:hypothetical protein
MLHQGSQWARLEDMESRFVWCFCTGDWAEHMKLCTFISYSVLLSWPGFSCEKSPKQTVQPVSWSWFFSTGNWGLFCEGNWRLLLQCYGIPCTQVHYHVIYNLVENHSMSFWPNRGELLSGGVKRSLMQIINKKYSSTSNSQITLLTAKFSNLSCALGRFCVEVDSLVKNGAFSAKPQ